MILHKNFCAFFHTKNMSFPKKVVGVNHLFWIFKSHHLHLTCFFDFFWREMSRPKNKNAQEKAVHFFFAEALPTSNFLKKNRLDVISVINNSNNFI